jgi:ATP-binding cassette subfamily B protein
MVRSRVTAQDLEPLSLRSALEQRPLEPARPRGLQVVQQRLQGLLDTVPEIADRPDAAALAGVIESVEFRNVSFFYKEGEPVLVDFNLRARRGETVALVGATGSGKSTVVSLLSRFYEPTSGTSWERLDYRSPGLHGYQSRFGIVSRRCTFFSGTIWENIRYGKAGADDKQSNWPRAR